MLQELKLTIAIPTYNRNEILYNNLVFLIPQLTKQVEVLILDNNSTIPVEKSIENLLLANPEVNIRIERNSNNIGMAANFMSCFEKCRTEWMWLLSDDDKPQFDSVSIILSDVNKFSQCCFLNYKSTWCAKRAGDSGYLVVEGINEFITKLDSIHNLMFISVGVYNVSKIIPQLRWGYMFSYSVAPHLALIFMTMNNNENICFSDTELVQWGEFDDNDRWSVVNISLALPILIELPLNLEAHNLSKFKQHIYSHIISDEYCFFDIYSKLTSENTIQLYTTFLTFLGRTILRKRGIKDKIRIWIWKKAFFNPTYLSLFYKLKGIDYKLNLKKSVPDRFNRI